MKYIVVITDTSPQFGGEAHIVCFNRREAVVLARLECRQARAIGVECYAKVLPKRQKIARELKILGWSD